MLIRIFKSKIYYIRLIGLSGWSINKKSGVDRPQKVVSTPDLYVQRTTALHSADRKRVNCKRLHP